MKPQVDKEEMFSEKNMKEVLLNMKFINPYHLNMIDSGHGEFPDTYILSKNGVDYIIEQFKKK